MITLWFASAASAGVVDSIAAVVNDEVIALSEVYELGKQFIERRCPEGEASCVQGAELEILDVQIRRTLVRQELDRLGLQVTAADVDRAIDDTVRQYPNLDDRAALRAEVEASGQRWDQYRQELFEYMRTQAFQGRILAPRVTVNDDELRDRFQREARRMKTRVAKVEGFGIPIPPDATEAAIQAIVADAEALVASINGGEIDWSTALANRDKAGVASMFGGKEFAPGDLVEALDQALFQAEAGKAIPPIALGNVLFVLSVRDFGERSVEVSFADAEEQIRNVIFQEKLVDAEEEWYQRTRREATVDIKIN